MLPSLLDCFRGDATKGLGAILCFVVTADKVAACVALPEWKCVEVSTVRVYFRSVREAGENIRFATAAINVHSAPLEVKRIQKRQQ